jgi:DNA polymerase III subunit chi
VTEVRFYHLTHSALDQALPQLLEKCLERDWRSVVLAGSWERVEALTRLLWTYKRDGFLPHGNREDGMAADQPVWLTEQDENPNAATVLFQTDGMETADLAGWTLVCDLFDGNDGDAIQAARMRWKSYKAAGHGLTYWQQGPSGWVKQA